VLRNKPTTTAMSSIYVSKNS